MLNEYGKSLFRPWCSVQNVVLGGAAIYLCGLAIRTYSLNSEEIASWVQAFGSILAILGAFAVGNHQAKTQHELSITQGLRDKENREAERNRRAKSYLAVVEHAANECQYVVDFTEGMPLEVFNLKWEGSYRELCSASISSLRSLPVHELGSHDLVLAYIGIVAGLANFINEAERVIVGDKRFHAPDTDLPYAGLVSHNSAVQSGFIYYSDSLKVADENVAD